jgi:hypothetical protein
VFAACYSRGHEYRHRTHPRRAVVLDDETPLPEDCRVTVIIEDGAAGFRLDEQSQEELVQAAHEIERGEYVSHQELFARLKRHD